jgi:hypothetical protein
VATGIGAYVIAWNPAAAQSKWIAIVAGIVLYYALVWLPEEIGERSVTRGIAILAPALLSIFFLLTFDWSYRIGKVGFLDPIMRILAMVRLPVGDELLNSNSAGGLLAALIPFQVNALFAPAAFLAEDGFEDGGNGRGLLLLRVALVLFSVGTLILSASRGAWLALGLVTAFWLTQKVVRRRWASLLIFGLLCLMIWLVAGDWLLRAVAADRIPVWTGSLELASDYAFTGIGPANFDMPYATYVLLSHVPYLSHAHNLYLDVWLDGGLLALFAMIVLFVTALRQAIHADGWRAAVFAATTVVAVHGLLDDALYAYAPLAQTFMWVPLALIARISPCPSRRFQVGQFASAGLALAVTTGLVFVLPSVHSVWETNLGALAQTKLELPGYSYLDWGQQDKKRREGNLDYTEVRAHYKAALVLDASTPMPNRRLAQIEIPFAEYDVALAHLVRAYSAAPNFRATRQMLGEMHAIHGNIDAAVQLWRSIDNRQNQLDMRLAWYESFITDAPRAAQMAEVLQQVKDTSDEK